MSKQTYPHSRRCHARCQCTKANSLQKQAAKAAPSAAQRPLEDCAPVSVIDHRLLAPKTGLFAGCKQFDQAHADVQFAEAMEQVNQV